MKPGKEKKVSKRDLRKEPGWLKRTHQAFKRGPLGKLSEEEIGQLSEEVAAEAAEKRQTPQSAR